MSRKDKEVLDKMITEQNTRRAPPKKKKTSRGKICGLCKSGMLWEKCNEYIFSCSDVENDEGKGKRRARFPNLAGLCRYLETGLDDLRLFKEKYPESYDRLLAIFEDEALNSDVSTTLLSAYMKKRLAFAVEEEVKGQKDTSREICYCFEHDVYADGE